MSRPLHTETHTFELLAISQHKSHIISIPVFRLLQNLEKILELPRGGEVAVVIEMDDGKLGVHLVVVHQLVVVVDLLVGQAK